MKLFLIAVTMLVVAACGGPTAGGSGNPTRSAMFGQVLLNGYTGQAIDGPSFTVAEAYFQKQGSEVTKRFLVEPSVSSRLSRATTCQTKSVAKTKPALAATASLLSVGTLVLGFPPDGSVSKVIDAQKDGSYQREFTELFEGGLYSVQAAGSSQAYPFQGVLLLPPAIAEGKIGDRSLHTEPGAIQKSVGMELSWAVGEVSNELPAVVYAELYTENDTEKRKLECSIEEEDLPKELGRRKWAIEAEKFKDSLATPGGLFYLTRVQGHRSSAEKVGEIIFLGAQSLVAATVVAE